MTLISLPPAPAIQAPVDPSALRAGERWVADTFVPYALCRAVRTAAERVCAGIEVAGRTRDQLKARLGEDALRSRLKSDNAVLAKLLNESVAASWEEVTGVGHPCPIEVLGFGTTMKKNQRLDDLVLRYSVAGNKPSRIWINHKLVTQASSGLERVGSVRSTLESSVGEKIVHWDELVAATADAVVSGRRLASLVLVIDTSGGSPEVICYEPCTVFAYRDRIPTMGLHPDRWPLHDSRLPAQVYARENSLVQTCHRDAESLYLAAAPALVASGVHTGEVVQLAAGRMFEDDAYGLRRLAESSEARLAEFCDLTGYVPATSQTAPHPALGIAPCARGTTAPRPLHVYLPADATGTVTFTAPAPSSVPALAA